ncbi:hypothetical protein [Sedimentisphaera salicampi]|uniref:Uncharacterized protein n=1 Tax=Sedimentisphaera salicampi TaxID=1941349 RepID=A0A1W6LQE0_9BACT|nr:hypothetical protein [Sedimentisphaera salicampi]ARN57976.1 hypothetical protein STSP1_02402 [Sedimentisphaera salicampi]OXU14141.1 hypothetical protein SMSP1_02303 [Sedimentisphaera salicampi]
MEEKERKTLTVISRWVLVLIALKLILYWLSLPGFAAGILVFVPAYIFARKITSVKFAMIYSAACFFNILSFISLAHLHARITCKLNDKKPKRAKFLE